MCGIAGIVHPRAGHAAAPSLDPALIRAMTAAIAHRGPDGEGFYEAPGIALGSRRLAIVDLAGGNQPFSDREGRVWVVFNGEIYNHLDLRQELAAAGHRFASRCDTEVLVHAYLRWGDAMVERLNGMFAFALWDAANARLLLARDPMGQKPLFYSRLADGTLIFASEVKALIAHSALAPEVDDAGLAAYLTFEYLPGDLSILRGARKLPPAHLATFAGGELGTREYWDLPIGEPPPAGGALDERFAELFDAAVERHLMADVPLGIFLSGGIDSSAVAAATVARRPPSSVKTFSIGFDDPSFDESAMARLVARHLGTDHHEHLFRVDTLREVLPEVVAKLDEPFGDASLLPMYLLSRYTREFVKVALGGDGSDELLLGYPTFRADPVARLFRRLPAPLRRAARALAGRLPVDTRNFSLDFVVKAFVNGADREDAWRHPLWLGSVNGSDADPLHPDLRREYPLARVLAPALQAYARPAGASPLQRLSYQYCKTYLAEDILHKLDRASMAVSLEARPPFLDRPLVELMARLPVRSKLSRTGTSKVVLRRAFAERLPRPVLARRKKGFGIPIGAWLKGPLSHLLSELLGSERVAAAGYFQPAVVARLVADHREGRKDNRKVLWTLLSFELWRERYGVGARR